MHLTSAVSGPRGSAVFAHHASGAGPLLRSVKHGTMPMNIIDPELGVPVTDLKRTVDFYVHRLFFETVSIAPSTCTLALGQDQVKFRMAHKDEVESLRELGFGLYFQIRDIHEYYRQVRTAGVMQFMQELELMQPGVWQFSLFDPNGFPVGFAMSAREKAA